MDLVQTEATCIDCWSRWYVTIAPELDVDDVIVDCIACGGTALLREIGSVVNAGRDAPR